MRYLTRLILFTMLLLTGCNLPVLRDEPTAAPDTPPSIPTIQVFNGPGVQILSPSEGAQLSADTPVQVQFSAAGGPFIEADLLIDNNLVASLPLGQDNLTPTGTFSWGVPTAGLHTLTVEVLTAEKSLYTASINIVVSGAESSTQPPASVPELTLTVDPGRESVRQQVISILHDRYQIDLADPTLMRKYRDGVPNDPWISVVYIKNWMYHLEIYPDRVVENVNPVNMFSDGSVITPPDQKALPVCNPRGTLKILVALVDFQNLGVTKADALGALMKVASELNAELAQYSTAVGANAPILVLQIDGVFLSPPPPMPDHLLTPAVIKSVSGVDTTQYDLLVQVDLDGNSTYRKILAAQNYDTFGFMQAGCKDQSLSIWISLENKDQALGKDMDERLKRTLSHELLHTFGYLYDHSWPCGDGSTPDATDQCDIYNWPTLILGWTDTDGDGIPEISDPTPYGMTAK